MRQIVLMNTCAMDVDGQRTSADDVGQQQMSPDDVGRQPMSDCLGSLVQQRSRAGVGTIQSIPGAAPM